MRLDARQKKMVRLAFRCEDADLRRAAVERVRASLVTATDPRHALRTAKYAPEFMQAVEGKKYRNPETGKRVKFVSLPTAEQKKLYQQWAASKQQQQPQQKAPGAEMVDMTDQVMQAITQMGPQPKKTEPKKTEPKTPPGKHKKRKELRARPTKKMSDNVTVSQGLEGLLLPEGMDEDRRAQGKKQLEGATYGLLAMLRDTAAHALSAPKSKHMKGLLLSGYTAEGVKKMHAALNTHLEDAEGRKYHPDVLAVANKYDLESEDADELRDFKGNKPARGRPLDPVQLMQKFLAKATPETRERMQGMSVDDFMAMYKSIMADEDEEEAEEAGTDAASKTATRLPQQPHAEVSRAIEDGRLAEDDEALSIFDPVPAEKTLSDEDRKIVRLAHATPDRELRRRILALLSV